MIEIASTQNPRIKNVVKLMNRKERDATKQFLIEGLREIERALANKFPLISLFFCEELIADKSALKQFQGLELISCTEPVFRKISYRESPDGFLAVARQVERGLDDLKAAKNALYLVAEGVEKPGNLGALLRSSDATGASGLLLSDKLTDIYNPNVVRASVGTLFSVPIVESDGESLAAFFKKHGIKTFAATPEAAIPYTQANFQGPSAIIVGTEHEGLSDFWKKHADERIFIPMHGIADSLNVSAAATLLLYEAIRQRD